MIAETTKHTAVARAMAKPLKRGRACMSCRYVLIVSLQVSDVDLNHQIPKNRECNGVVPIDDGLLTDCNRNAMESNQLVDHVVDIPEMTNANTTMDQEDPEQGF